MTRGNTFTATVELVVETCFSCQMQFAMPVEFKNKALRKHGPGPGAITFYCPAGHSQWYLGESEEDKLRRERDRLKQDAARLMDELAAANRRASDYKNHATRMTTRAKAGVCPCCNRTFKQLAAHMANKHPEFTPLKLEVVK
jgi:hypothetical protein